MESGGNIGGGLKDDISDSKQLGDISGCGKHWGRIFVYFGKAI